MLIMQLDDEQLSELIENSLRKVLQEITPTPTEDLMTIQEAASFLNLTVATLYVKVSKKELPHLKQGKRLYFSRLELLEHLKKSRKKQKQKQKQKQEAQETQQVQEAQAC